MRKIAAICIALMLVITVGAEAAGSPPEAAHLFSLINRARSNWGIAELRYDSDLHHIAVAAVLWMASHLSLRDPIPPCYPGGSNAGVGVSVHRLNLAFMASNDHRANRLNRHFTRGATATRRDDRGQLWAAEVFCG